MINDPDAFSRTSRTLGAQSAYVQDLMLQRLWAMEHSLLGRMHAILWPTLAGGLLVAAVAYLSCRYRRRRRQRRRAQPGSLLAANNSDAYMRCAAGLVHMRARLPLPCFARHLLRIDAVALLNRHAGCSKEHAAAMPRCRNQTQDAFFLTRLVPCAPLSSQVALGPRACHAPRPPPRQRQRHQQRQRSQLIGDRAHRRAVRGARPLGSAAAVAAAQRPVAGGPAARQAVSRERRRRRPGRQLLYQPVGRAALVAAAAGARRRCRPRQRPAAMAPPDPCRASAAHLHPRIHPTLTTASAPSDPL